MVGLGGHGWTPLLGKGRIPLPSSLVGGRTDGHDVFVPSEPWPDCVVSDRRSGYNTALLGQARPGTRTRRWAGSPCALRCLRPSSARWASSALTSQRAMALRANCWVGCCSVNPGCRLGSTGYGGTEKTRRPRRPGASQGNHAPRSRAGCQPTTGCQTRAARRHPLCA